MARPKKTVEVPGQEPAPLVDALHADQQPIQDNVGELLADTALADTALNERNTLLGTINEQGAAIIARFEEYDFTDIVGHPLSNNLEFLQLVKKATTAEQAAPHGYVTNEEGKSQPVSGKPVLTERGWHVPG